MTTEQNSPASDVRSMHGLGGGELPDAPELRSCPYCKGEARARICPGGGFVVRCRECEASSGEHADAPAARDDWNQRAEYTANLISEAEDDYEAGRALDSLDGPEPEPPNAKFSHDRL